MSTNENQIQQTEENGDVRYILITQCLQNDFFLNRECKLRLPDNEVKKMLIGKSGPDLKGKPDESRVQLGRGYPDKGPLGLFLKAVIDRRRRGKDGRGTLHVINIRDWHEPGASYDQERRRYSVHCEKGTWGADYIEGLGEYLDPANTESTPSSAESQFFEEGSVRIYHIHSDSVFDFKPRLVGEGRRPGGGKFWASELENILDVIMLGSDDQFDELTRILTSAASSVGYEKALDDLAEEVNGTPQSLVRVYIAVIGVYTDVKIKTLLMGLCSRYDIPSLAVSDTLTASPSLERHLGALDFAQKVLQVEVIHGLNNLIRFLGGTPIINNELEIVAAERFSRYASFFQDKQNVLAYQTEKLQDYLRLTEDRAVEVYESIQGSNRFLMLWGSAFLILTLVGAVLSAIWPDRFDWKLPLVTGGLSLLQLVSAFYSKPMEDLQQNLTNLATFKMILESHSLKTAFARFHLTTPQTLRELQDEDEAKAAARQIEVLEKQLAVIEKSEEADYQALKDLGFGVGETAQKVLEAKPEE
jgi:nicotinamidase-related amidase